ncbi:uncharacterized protein [Amphiura filiformis]|uniref:uncharacterized protein n=1 Tax=Amphiura filiformis TaxID=82378 RepID=UPI003B20ED0F
MNRQLIVFMVVVSVAVAAAKHGFGYKRTTLVADLVNAANEKWGQMLRGKNAEGFASLYTEDTQVLPTGSPPLIGRAAVEMFAESFFLSEVKDAKVETVLLDPTADSVAEGGTFWERGKYVFYNDAGDVIDVGKYLGVWKKIANGNIKMYIDSFNSNNA